MLTSLSLGFHFFWFPDFRSSYLNSPETIGSPYTDTPQDRQLEIDFLMWDYQTRHVTKAFLKSTNPTKYEFCPIKYELMYMESYNKQTVELKNALDQHPGPLPKLPAPHDEVDWLFSTAQEQYNLYHATRAPPEDDATNSVNVNDGDRTTTRRVKRRRNNE